MINFASVYHKAVGKIRHAYILAILFQDTFGGKYGRILIIIIDNCSSPDSDKEFLNNWFNFDCSKEGQNLVILNLDNQLTQNIPDTF